VSDTERPDLSGGERDVVSEAPAETIDAPGRAPEGTIDAPGDAVDADADVEAAAAAVEADLEAIVSERDEYLALARRVQADFENFRKRMLRQGADERERGAALIAEKLLPVLDACDGALAHDESKPHVRPIYDALMDVLEKEGLTVVYPAGEPFDPTVHEAVIHEPAGAEDESGPVVSEVLRTGYRWNDRVLRPAMVKVRG
jgi:molecular chaperone GrpE